MPTAEPTPEPTEAPTPTPTATPTPAPKTYTVTLQGGTGYAIAATGGSKSPVNAGGSFSFTVTPSNGYTRGNGFSVKANGTTLTSNNGVYTISNINANQTVSVSGIVKSQNTGGGTLPAAPAITTTTLAAATMGKEYRQQITATGGTPMFLPIPGLDNREFVKTAIEVLRGRTLYGKRVVVAGGGMTGAETAVFLAVQGCDVTMIEMAPDIITDAVAQPRACLLEHIRKYNVKVHTHTKLTKVGEGTVYAEEYGEPVEFKHIDMLVNAMGVRSNNPLKAELEGCDCKVVVVGDASSTKNGYKNIREGFNAGNAI